MTLYSHSSLGKLFISYSSKDKSFVSRLVSALEKNDYEVWLDERELFAGDSLPSKLSQAIASSKVVIVIISKHSKGSKWLHYEINHAIERMVKGECRLIPVLTGEVNPTLEIKGLVYADFRKSFKIGFKSVIQTLEHEKSRYSLPSFWVSIEKLLRKEFGGLGSGLLSGEYRSQNYNFVSLTGEVEIGYETVTDYGEAKALSSGWWTEFDETISNLGIPYFLLITERPIGFDVKHFLEDTDNRIMRIDTRSNIVGVDIIKVIVVDMSGLKRNEERRKLIKKAKKVLENLAKEDAA